LSSHFRFGADGQHFISLFVGITLLALVALFISGCSSTQRATFQIPDSGGPPWEIQARWYDVGDQLTVLINGTPVLNTSVNIFSGEGGAEGVYEGKKITAKVFKSGELFQEKTIVQVFVEENLAAEFAF
jgi:hypothetical protein